jgi:signal transduction histidine kinase
VIAKEPVRNVFHDADDLIDVVLSLQLCRARSTTFQMDHTVRALREFLTKGQRIEEPFKVEVLLDLLKEAIQPLVVYARDENFKIRLNDDYPNLRVFVAKREITRAFQNLLHNAIKYSWYPSPGRPRFVKIHVNCIDQLIHITFENYGVPITQEEIDKGYIFQVGYRGLISGDRSRMGTGIGLADALAIAKDHGGDVKVTSRPASGDMDPKDYSKPFLTRVVFILPIYDFGGK